MKQLKLFILIFCFPVSLFAQVAPAGKFTLIGKLKDFSPGVLKEIIYITYSNGKKHVSDSVKLVKNAFVYTGSIMEPVAATVSFYKPRTKPNSIAGAGTVILMPGKLAVTFTNTFLNENVTGSKAHIEFAKFKATNKSLFDEMKSNRIKIVKLSNTKEIEDKLKMLLSAKSREEADIYRKDEELKKLFDATAKFQDLEGKQREEYPEYLKTTPSTLLLAAFTPSFMRNDDLVAEVYNTLPTNLQKWPTGIKMKEVYDMISKTSIGTTAIEFTLNDVNGKPVSLSSFRGKYVLIDFWASWCDPCRTENPYVVAAHNKFKDKNFTILGVSLDKEKNKWVEAIEKDKLNWTNVSDDLQGSDKATSKDYGVRSIPANFLISPDGKIVAKDLRGKELEKKLEEVLK